MGESVSVKHQLCIYKKFEKKVKPSPPPSACARCDRSAAWPGLARDCKVYSQLGHTLVKVNEPKCETTSATIQSQPNQHRIVLTDKKSRASEQVVFEFPKTGPKRGELEDVENGGL
jgi:hypothetical protein